MLKRKWPIIVLIPLIIIIIMFLILPFFTVVEGSFRKDGETAYSLYNYTYALSNKLYYRSILNSLRISFYSTIVGIIIATQGAYSLTKMNEKLKEKIMLLSNMISNFSGLLLAFAFILIFGNSGFITLILKELNLITEFDVYSETGLLIAYIYFQIPLGMLLLYPSFESIKTEWQEAANLLGASKIYYWRRIVIPTLFPNLMGTGVILFANAMGAYATAYGLTGTNFNILSIRISTLVAGDVFLKPNLAASLAMILTAILCLIIITNEVFFKKGRWEK